RSLRTMDGSGGELVSAKGVLLLEEGENSNSSYQRGSFLQQAADAYLTFRSLQQLAQPNSDEPQFLSSPDISSNQSKFPYNGVGLALNVIGAGFTPVKSDFRQLLSTVTKSSIKGMAVTGKVLGAAGFAFTAYQFGSKVADPNQQLTVNDYMDFGVGASTFVAGLLVANPVGVAVVITVGVGYGLYTIWRDNGN
ncbi:MAG: hypothetical protein JST48_10985, partial [Bacteroidetes bacterium]|nr:hypothetical protein [Bacteroidota bacterium]